MEALNALQRERGASLGLLYRRHSRWLARMVRRSGRADAEDIVQEAFLRLSRYPTDGLAHPRALLLRVAENVIRNSVRSAKAAKNTCSEGDPRAPTDLVHADQYERVLLQEIVLSLPEAYRDVFVLGRICGMTNAQIAQACNLTVKSVEWRMSKALALCAERMR